MEYTNLCIKKTPVASFPIVAIPSSVCILKGVSVIHALMLLSDVTFNAGGHKTPPKKKMVGWGVTSEF
jgi:hypothetical protein